MYLESPWFLAMENEPHRLGAGDYKGRAPRGAAEAPAGTGSSGNPGYSLFVPEAAAPEPQKVFLRVL